MICSPGDPEYIVPGSPEYNDVIGCSEVAAILGKGHKSANEVWMQKTHRAPATEHKSIFDRGLRMEPVMAEMIQSRHGRVLKSEQVQYRDPDRPWLIFHADGMFPKHCPLSSGEAGLEGPGPWEAKAPGMRMTDTMSRDGIKEMYLVQGQMGMHVAGCALGHVLAWGTFGFLDYDVWELIAIDCKASWDFQRDALAKLDAFYECLCTDTPPTPINPSELPPVPGVTTDQVVLEDEDIVRYSKDLAALTQPLKDAKAQDKALRAWLKENLGNHGNILVPGVMEYSYKYGKAKETVDGVGLLAYCEFLTEIYAELYDGEGRVDKPVFDRTHWVTPKPPTRTLRPKVIGENNV